MAYTIAVIPNTMAAAGLPKVAILTAMVMMIAITSIAMGLYTNMPFVLAPGLGSVALFSVTLVQGMGVPWQDAAGMIFISGMVFVILTFLGIRDIIVKMIPSSIKVSIGAGIGLFIALLGFKNAGIIVANAKSNVLGFGNLNSAVVILALIGFVITISLMSMKIRSYLLLGILATTIIGIPMGITKIPTHFFAFPSGISDIAFKLNPLGALSLKYFPFMFAFFMTDFFSNLGTTLGVGAKAGLLDEKGDFPGIEKCFKVDSIGCVIGSFFSIPVMTTYLESAAGVEAGGRTGLTAITTSIMFLLTLLITPVATMIPSVATAPVLILIGISMLTTMRNINYEDMTEYLPAFLSIVLTIFTYNVANGIAAGIIMYVILKVVGRKFNEIHPGLYVICLPLLYYFYLLK